MNKIHLITLVNKHNKSIQYHIRHLASEKNSPELEDEKQLKMTSIP